MTRDLLSFVPCLRFSGKTRGRKSVFCIDKSKHAIYFTIAYLVCSGV